MADDDDDDSGTGWWKVVNTPGLYIFSGPSTNSKSLGELKEGAIIEELDYQGDWIKHSKGWSLSYDSAQDLDYLEEVDEPQQQQTVIIQQQPIYVQQQQPLQQQMNQQPLQQQQNMYQQGMNQQYQQPLQQQQQMYQQGQQMNQQYQQPLQQQQNMYQQGMNQQYQQPLQQQQQQQQQMNQQFQQKPLQQQQTIQTFSNGAKITLRNSFGAYLAFNNGVAVYSQQAYIFTLVQNKNGFGLCNSFGDYATAETSPLALGLITAVTKKLGDYETFTFMNSGINNGYALQTCHKDFWGVSSFVVDNGNGGISQQYRKTFGPNDSWSVAFM